jgi:nucleotide-binding universal stress UspA family protein
MFRKILCPVDFSESSDRALDYALALGKRYATSVSVMHVLPTVLADPDLYPYLTEPVLASPEARDRAYRRLGEFVHRALASGIGAEIFLEDGDVVELVLRKAKDLGADLVVMGTHGRRGFSRLILGSVTERVLRQSGSPVLSISPTAPKPEPSGGPFRRILCPVDFSPSSLAGLELAVALRQGEGDLVVVHIVEFYLPPGLGESVAFDITGLRERHRSEGRARLEAVLPPESRAHIRLETVLLESGSPYREVLKTAEREKSDLIVMGVAGRSSADMAFFGSTTNHVVREARCPVLTVRAPDSKSRQGDEVS